MVGGGALLPLLVVLILAVPPGLGAPLPQNEPKTTTTASTTIQEGTQENGANPPLATAADAKGQTDVQNPGNAQGQAEPQKTTNGQVETQQQKPDVQAQELASNSGKSAGPFEYASPPAVYQEQTYNGMVPSHNTYEQQPTYQPYDPAAYEAHETYGGFDHVPPEYQEPHRHPEYDYNPGSGYQLDVEQGYFPEAFEPQESYADYSSYGSGVLEEGTQTYGSSSLTGMRMEGERVYETGAYNRYTEQGTYPYQDPNLGGDAYAAYQYGHTQYGYDMDPYHGVPAGYADPDYGSQQFEYQQSEYGNAGPYPTGYEEQREVPGSYGYEQPTSDGGYDMGYEQQTASQPYGFENQQDYGMSASTYDIHYQRRSPSQPYGHDHGRNQQREKHQPQGHQVRNRQERRTSLNEIDSSRAYRNQQKKRRFSKNKPRVDREAKKIERYGYRLDHGYYG